MWRPSVRNPNAPPHPSPSCKPVNLWTRREHWSPSAFSASLTLFPSSSSLCHSALSPVHKSMRWPTGCVTDRSLWAAWKAFVNNIVAPLNSGTRFYVAVSSGKIGGVQNVRWGESGRGLRSNLPARAQLQVGCDRNIVVLEVFTIQGSSASISDITHCVLKDFKALKDCRDHLHGRMIPGTKYVLP